MKKVITMIMMMLVMSMIIPVCAYAQTYEEAEMYDAVIEELLYEEFRYDAEGKMWILEQREDDSDEGYAMVKATYDMYYNLGNIDYKYYLYDDNGDRLATEATINFKWYEKHETFGMTYYNLTEYEETDNWISFF